MMNGHVRTGPVGGVTPLRRSNCITRLTSPAVARRLVETTPSPAVPSPIPLHQEPSAQHGVTSSLQYDDPAPHHGADLGETGWQIALDMIVERLCKDIDEAEEVMSSSSAHHVEQWLRRSVSVSDKKELVNLLEDLDEGINIYRRASVAVLHALHVLQGEMNSHDGPPSSSLDSRDHGARATAFIAPLSKLERLAEPQRSEATAYEAFLQRLMDAEAMVAYLQKQRDEEFQLVEELTSSHEAERAEWARSCQERFAQLMQGGWQPRVTTGVEDSDANMVGPTVISEEHINASAGSRGKPGFELPPFPPALLHTSALDQLRAKYVTLEMQAQAALEAQARDAAQEQRAMMARCTEELLDAHAWGAQLLSDSEHALRVALCRGWFIGEAPPPFLPCSPSPSSIAAGGKKDVAHATMSPVSLAAPPSLTSVLSLSHVQTMALAHADATRKDMQATLDCALARMAAQHSSEKRLWLQRLASMEEQKKRAEQRVGKVEGAVQWMRGQLASCGAALQAQEDIVLHAQLERDKLASQVRVLQGELEDTVVYRQKRVVHQVADENFSAAPLAGAVVSRVKVNPKLWSSAAEGRRTLYEEAPSFSTSPVAELACSASTGEHVTEPSQACITLAPSLFTLGEAAKEKEGRGVRSPPRQLQQASCVSPSPIGHSAYKSTSDHLRSFSADHNKGSDADVVFTMASPVNDSRALWLLTRDADAETRPPFTSDGSTPLSRSPSIATAEGREDASFASPASAAFHSALGDGTTAVHNRTETSAASSDDSARAKLNLMHEQVEDRLRLVEAEAKEATTQYEVDRRTRLRQERSLKAKVAYWAHSAQGNKDGQESTADAATQAKCEEGKRLLRQLSEDQERAEQELQDYLDSSDVKCKELRSCLERIEEKQKALASSGKS